MRMSFLGALLPRAIARGEVEKGALRSALWSSDGFRDGSCEDVWRTEERAIRLRGGIWNAFERGWRSEKCFMVITGLPVILTWDRVVKSELLHKVIHVSRLDLVQCICQHKSAEVA